MITRNAYTIAYEYSASNGDQVSTVNIDRINANREIQCTKNIDDSTNILTVSDDEWAFVLCYLYAIL